MARSTLAGVAAAAILVLAAGARAQDCTTDGSPLGSLYLSFSPDHYDQFLGTEKAIGGDPTDLVVPPFSLFEFYLVLELDYCDCGDCGLNASLGLSSWEARLDLELAPEVTTVAAEFQPLSSSNFGNPLSINFLVGTGSCIHPADTPYAVVSFAALLTNSAGSRDQVLRLAPAAGHSARSAPAWDECRPDGWASHPFYSAASLGPDGARAYEDGFIVLNPTNVIDIVPTKPVSWGVLKQRF